MFGRRVAATGAATAAWVATGNDVISADTAREAAAPPYSEAGWCSGLAMLLLEATAIAGAAVLGGAGAPRGGKPRPSGGKPRPRGGKFPPNGFNPPNGCMVKGVFKVPVVLF
jgi:hypothetical protein